MGNLYLKIFYGWCFSCYNSTHHPVGRIAIGWNPRAFDVNIIISTGQLMSCIVQAKNRSITFASTYVYAFNFAKERVALKDDLQGIYT